MSVIYFQVTRFWLKHFRNEFTKYQSVYMCQHDSICGCFSTTKVQAQRLSIYLCRDTPVASFWSLLDQVNSVMAPRRLAVCTKSWRCPMRERTCPWWSYCPGRRFLWLPWSPSLKHHCWRNGQTMLNDRRWRCTCLGEIQHIHAHQGKTERYHSALDALV